MDKLSVFKRKHGALWDECMQGDIHFRIFSHLLNSLKEKPGLYNTYMTFMGFTLDAHLACARLSLMKLFDRTGNTESIDELHRYAQNSLSKDVQNGKLKDISLPMLTRAMSIGESIFKKLGNRPGVLKGQRDKHFVHLSREYAEDYKKVYDTFQITTVDLSQLFAASIEILEAYQHILPGPSGSLAVCGVERDVENSLIKMEREAKREDVPDQLYYERFKLAPPSQ